MNRYLIIGSGLIGRLLAWRLLKAGHKVDLLSKDGQSANDSAGFIAAAMVSPATEAVQTEPMVKTMGLASLKLWPRWLAELPEPIFYQNNGTLVVAHAGDQSEMLRFRMRAEHSLNNDDFSLLNQQQLAEKEPDLDDKFDQSLFFKDESCIDNRHLYRVLTDVLVASEQCRWLQCDPVEHISEQVVKQLSQQYFNQDANDYTATIDCRGNGAKQDVADLRSVRGEVIRVHAPDVDLKHAIRLIHPRYPFYLAPRPNNEYFLGATVIENEDMSEVSVRSGLELMSALYSIHKGFGEARILEMAAHCRPATIDNMPKIQRTDWGFHINGFYRHGYLFSPAMITDFLSVLDDKPENVLFKDYFDV